MIIIITRPEFFADEPEIINRMFAAGLERLHLRKPDAEPDDVRRLLDKTDTINYGKIVLHDHHFLANEYGLVGIHLNSRNPEPPVSWQGTISASCHSLAELQGTHHACNYRFLSPIFDSISKRGYASAFSFEQLQQARDAGIINQSVYALGGVTIARLPQVRALGFGGAALLGEPWSIPHSGTAIEKYIEAINHTTIRQNISIH